MKLKYYEVDEDKILEEAKRWKKVAIKLPDGLINYSSKILDFLNENGIEAYLIANSCYGACDFVMEEMKDAIICIGEAEMPYIKHNKISFIEARYNFNEEILKKAFPFLKGSIGIVSITPFIHKINDCKKFLEENGFKVLIGKKSRRLKYDGQILGCDFTSAMEIASKVNSFLFIGDGFFHPVGLALATGKEIIAINPIEKKIYKNEIEEMKEKILRQRYAAISKAMDAKKFGIIISYKIGQRRMQLAKNLKKLIEKNGKKAYLILLNKIDEKINYLSYDCYVSTACPRVAIDDFMKYEKPILTPIELQILFGERKWEDYEFDQIL